MNNKIKVCFVQSFGYSAFNPDSDARIGGAEVDFYNISTELANDSGYDVAFLTGDFGQKPVEIYKKVKLIKSYSHEKTLSNLLNSFFSFFKKLIQINADVYITAGYTKEIGLVSLYRKCFNKIHIHRTEHDTEFKKESILVRFKKRKIIGLLYYLGFLTTDYFIVQNREHQKALLENFNYPSCVIKNSYRIPKSKNYEKRYVLWIARGEKWKRPELFIKLAANFPNTPFIMIMPKGSNLTYFEEVKLKADKLKNLTFIGGVPFSEVDTYYQRAKIFVNTSKSEGFPNSFNQAMNYSTPLLSLNISPDDFIQKNNLGYFCNNDFNLLKKRLKQLLSDDDLWTEISKNTHQYVKKHMNIKKSIKKWKRIISLLQEKNI